MRLRNETWPHFCRKCQRWRNELAVEIVSHITVALNALPFFPFQSVRNSLRPNVHTKRPKYARRVANQPKIEKTKAKIQQDRRNRPASQLSSRRVTAYPKSRTETPNVCTTRVFSAMRLAEVEIDYPLNLALEEPTILRC